MDGSLTFSIYPQGESISLAIFLRAVRDVGKLIRDVDYVVTHRRTTRVWLVTDLHSSAPTITVTPASDGRETVAAVTEGVRRLASENLADPPEHFSAAALEDVRRMERLFKGRADEAVRQIVFRAKGSETAAIRPDTSAKVERIISSGYSILGSLEGMLEEINVHGNRASFTVWDRVSGHPVRCSIPKEPAWVERAKGLLESRVLVVGLVHYFRNGIPRMVTNVREVRDTAPDPSLPRAGFGSIPDLTGDKSGAEYLRAIR